MTTFTSPDDTPRVSRPLRVDQPLHHHGESTQVVEPAKRGEDLTIVDVEVHVDDLLRRDPALLAAYNELERSHEGSDYATYTAANDRFGAPVSSDCALQTPEDLVRADPAPDHVRIAGADLVAVVERRTAVGRPGDLPDAGVALDALDAQRGVDAARPEAGDQAPHRSLPRCLLRLRQPSVVTSKTRDRLEGRHYSSASRGMASSAAKKLSSSM